MDGCQVERSDGIQDEIMEDLERVHVKALVIAVDQFLEHVRGMDTKMPGDPKPIFTILGLEACRIMVFQNRLPLPGENF